MSVNRTNAYIFKETVNPHDFSAFHYPGNYSMHLFYTVGESKQWIEDRIGSFSCGTIASQLANTINRLLERHGQIIILRRIEMDQGQSLEDFIRNISMWEYKKPTEFDILVQKLDTIAGIMIETMAKKEWTEDLKKIEEKDEEIILSLDEEEA